jgi:hypothetical protein
MKRIQILLMLIACMGCSNDDDGGTQTSDLAERKRTACVQIMTAVCQTLVRCGAVPPNFDCTELPDSEIVQCTTDLVDDFTEGQVDTCAADSRVVVCSDICDRVPQDPVSCQSLDQTGNTEVIECTY